MSNCFKDSYDYEKYETYCTCKTICLENCIKKRRYEKPFSQNLYERISQKKY